MLYFSNTPPAPPSRISRGGGDSLRNCPRIILSSLNGIQVFVFRDFVDFLLACKSPFLSFFLSFFLFPPPKEKFLLETVGSSPFVPFSLLFFPSTMFPYSSFLSFFLEIGNFVAGTKQEIRFRVPRNSLITRSSGQV